MSNIGLSVRNDTTRIVLHRPASMSVERCEPVAPREGFCALTFGAANRDSIAIYLSVEQVCRLRDELVVNYPMSERMEQVS